MQCVDLRTAGGGRGATGGGGARGCQRAGQPRADYVTGHGVTQDYVEAHMWFNLAAAQQAGEERDGTVVLRDAVADRMTAEQVAEAQRRAREWTPLPEP